MSKIAPMISCCSALTLCFVLLTVSVSAQTTPTMAPTTTQGDLQRLATLDAVFVDAPPETPERVRETMSINERLSQPGTAATPYGVPNAGIQPGMMGGPMTGGAMPGVMSGIYGMGARPGGYGGAMGGVDPEMQAFLNNRLQNLRSAETQINNDITMAGGEASPAARQLIMQRAQLQGQIRELEQQVGTSPMGTVGMGTAAMPGAAANPMAGMQGGMGMGTGMPPGAANPYGMPNMMGAAPDRMILEQLRQEAMTDLRYVQQTLSYIGSDDPVRADIESRQSEILKQIESLNKQLEQSNTAAGTNTANPFGMPAQPPLVPNTAMNAAGTDSSAASSLQAFQQRQQLTPRQEAQLAASQGTTMQNAAIDPRLIQMRDAERQLRAMGETAIADDLLRQIEEAEKLNDSVTNPQLQNGPLQNNVLPPGNIATEAPLGARQPSTTDIVRQAEIIELQNTVESLRNEIASMREEIRSLETVLRQFNQTNPLPPQNNVVPTVSTPDNANN